MTDKVDQRTVSDFGEQWTKFTDNSGYYGSVDLFADICGPLLDMSEVKGKSVADIGSGTGRIVNMLLDAGAAHVTGIEPSEAHAVAVANTAARADRVDILKADGSAVPLKDFDLVVSIGVLHHIVDPDPIVRAACRGLRPGGKLLVWLYGKEGNRLYLAVFGTLRTITKRLPHGLLSGLTYVLDAVAMGYLVLTRIAPLPMRGYMQTVYARLTPDKRRLVIYDQLNPAHAKYYSEAEAQALLERNGFLDVKTHRRHGYSWTVVGTRPER